MGPALSSLRSPRAGPIRIYRRNVALAFSTAALLAACITPLILGNPFFVSVAVADTTSNITWGRKCAQTASAYTVNDMHCVNAGNQSIQCSGVVRVYFAKYGCADVVPGNGCYAISYPGNYTLYEASGAAVTNRSTIEIAYCLGWDLSTATCILGLLGLIAGFVVSAPVGGAVLTTVLINGGSVATLASCAKSAYDLWCKSGCCFLDCRPGVGEIYGIRPWC